MHLHRNLHKTHPFTSPSYREFYSFCWISFLSFSLNTVLVQPTCSSLSETDLANINMVWLDLVSPRAHLPASLLRPGDEQRAEERPSVGVHSPAPIHLTGNLMHHPLFADAVIEICSGFLPPLLKLNQMWRKWNTVWNVNALSSTLPLQSLYSCNSPIKTNLPRSFFAI